MYLFSNSINIFFWEIIRSFSYFTELEQNIFVYQISKNQNDNTVDIAYQFIQAYINIEKAHIIKKGKVFDNSYERFGQAQTIQIVSSLIGNVDKNDLQKAIDEEKKKLLLQ